MNHPKYNGKIIDAHTHFDLSSTDTAEAVLRKTGIATVVNLWDAVWPPIPFEQWSPPWSRMGSAMAVCHVPDLSSVGAADFARKLALRIRDAEAQGAAALKVWKNLGLWLHDSRGNRVSVDDDRLDVLWHSAAETGLPIVIHVGDPPGFFQPITPDNERYHELRLRPQWWFGGEQHPSLETIHDEFENVVASNPDTTFVAAHFGCFMPFEEVERMFREYGNFFVDTSARLEDLGKGDVTYVSDLIRKFSHRIIFGTDLARTSNFEMPDLGVSKRAEVEHFYDLHWRFFESAEKDLSLPLPFGRSWTLTGINLEPDVLKLLYQRNAERVFRLGADLS